MIDRMNQRPVLGGDIDGVHSHTVMPQLSRCAQQQPSSDRIQTRQCMAVYLHSAIVAYVQGSH
jgi:hypothetical protein